MPGAQKQYYIVDDRLTFHCSEPPHESTYLEIEKKKKLKKIKKLTAVSALKIKNLQKTAKTQQQALPAAFIKT